MFSPHKNLLLKDAAFSTASDDPTPHKSVWGLRLAEARQDEMALPVALAGALFGHLLIIGLIVTVIFLLQWFGINIPLFSEPTLKERQIEFVLVDNKAAPPRDKNTKNRADRATRAGGQKIANMRQAEPQRAAGNPGRQAAAQQSASRPAPAQRQVAAKPSKPSQAARPTPAQRPTPQPQPRQPISQARPQQQPQRQPQPEQPPSPTPPKTPPKVAPKAPPKLPTNNQLATLPPSPAPGAIRVPAPRAPNPSSVTGPVVSTPVGTSGGGRPSGSPGPSQIPGRVSGASAGGAGQSLASASGGSRGGTPGTGGQGGRGSFSQSGSPGGGGGPAGIDALPEPDFGPYIAELQRRIKRNWAPPSDNRNKRIVALFTIGRDGRLLAVNIQQSSGVQIADEAAIRAVKASAPFRPLPVNFRGSDIDVQFIFDYNVYTGKSSGISYQ
ncbi:MAG: energy transducer TonB [Candidatus Melainabacteria bacterium]|nr:energy transducer TonB [Candidatus Melainabacteria bacterium]